MLQVQPKQQRRALARKAECRLIGEKDMAVEEQPMAERAPRRMTGAERRKVIVQATIDVVAEHGVQGATTARIANAAGISEKTLYSHFPSRRDMLIAALDAVFERAMLMVRERHHPNPIEHLRIAAKLHWPMEREFVHPLYEFFASSPQEDLRRELRARHQAHVDVVAGIIDEGKALGVVRPEVDSEQAAWEFYAVFWAEDIAFMIGFDDFGTSGRSVLMIERMLREISV